MKKPLPWKVVLTEPFDSIDPVLCRPRHHKAGIVAEHNRQETAELHVAKNNKYYGRNLYVARKEE